MNANKVDMYIYLGAANDSGAVLEVPERVRNTTGVVGADFNQYVKHLIDVKYDPALVKSGHILDTVRSQGCNAWMFGM